jgi:hypothetical protein
MVWILAGELMDPLQRSGNDDIQCDVDLLRLKSNSGDFHTGYIFLISEDRHEVTRTAWCSRVTSQAMRSFKIPVGESPAGTKIPTPL